MSPRAVGLLAGFALDRLLGDPRRYHPVAGFGSVAMKAERAWYADDRARGVLHTATLVGGAVAFGAAAERLAPGRIGTTLVTAGATWAVLGGRSLEREALAVHAHLDRDDLPAARQRLTHLVGRDTEELDASEVSRAVVESVAENTSDAVVAPLVWGAVAGVPGLLGYRAANTLDAMVGHHNDRYERFGWASARLDDVLNLPGSRLSGLLTLAAAPSRARQAWEAWRRDAARHPSPNAPTRFRRHRRSSPARPPSRARRRTTTSCARSPQCSTSSASTLRSRGSRAARLSRSTRSNSARA